MAVKKAESTDKELVGLAIADPEKFGALVDRYWSRLFAYVRRTTYFTTEDIEDVLQEVFVKVYRFLNDYDSSMTFSTWIYQITRNAVIDEIRKKNARPQTARLEAEELIKFFRSGLDVKKEIENSDSLEKIKKIMDGLPFKYREALILRFLEEKNYEEIMDILKLPKGTVASLVSRGRQTVIAEARKQGLI